MTQSALLSSVLLLPTLAVSQAVAVHHIEGRSRGFVVLRDPAGRQIGYGEMSQEATGDRVDYHMAFHFRDGSIADETTTYSQHGTFQLLAEHHVQKGPFFSVPLDLSVQANGQATNRTVDKSGAVKEETSHIDLEAGTAVDGMLSTLFANIDPHAPPFKLPFLSPTPKPRLFHFAVSSVGRGTFRVAGIRQTAEIFRLHAELGGVAGVVAPLIGKEPKDILIWIVEGEAPALVRAVGQMAEGGPMVDIQVAGATFPRNPAP